MKILQIDSGKEMRGGQWQALRLHESLLKAGHESVLMARAESPLFLEAIHAEVPVEELRPLAIAMRSRRFDLLHAHDSRSHTFCALYSRVPFVVARRVAFSPRSTVFSKWKYARAAMYIAVSKYVAERLRAYGIPEQRIRVVYDGVPVPDQPARGNRIIAPWSADPSKGMAIAERAALLAGIDLTLSRHLPEDLPLARALVYLSRFEGLGSGILLGMAHGVPVVASRVGGIPEIVEDGVTGLLVANEPDAVASAILHLTPAMGEAARRVVMERYTVDHMVRGTIAAYNEVLARA